ncbi:unnamed protein product [Arctogadus glacialis]
MAGDRVDVKQLDGVKDGGGKVSAGLTGVCDGSSTEDVLSGKPTLVSFTAVYGPSFRETGGAAAGRERFGCPVGEPSSSRDPR